MSATPSATPSANTISGATENNQRLFLRFRKVFAENNPREFAQFAEKLTKWLGDRKAYYEAARPEIIRLLLVAETTVRAALNVPSPELIIPFNVHDHPPHPLVPPYVSMVETVCRFEDLFEPAFKEYIKRMRANITPPPGYPLLSSMTRNHFLSSETPPPPKAVVQPLPDPDNKPQPSYPDGPSPPYSAHSETMPAPTLQVPAPVRTRKVKKKKTLDFEALARADIEDLMKQQKSQSGDVNSLKVTEPQVAPTSQIAGPSNQMSTLQQRPEENASRPETMATAGITQTTLFTSPEPLNNEPMEVDSHSEAEVSSSVGVRKDPTASPTPVIGVGPGNQANTQETAGLQTQAGRLSSAEAANLTSRQSPSQPTASRAALIPPQEKASGPTSQPETMSMEIDNQEQSQHVPSQEAAQDQTAMDIDSIHPTSSHVGQESLPLPGNNLRAASSMSISPRQLSVALSKGAAEQAAPGNAKDNRNHSTERHLEQSDAAETSNAIHSTIKSMTPAADQSIADTFAGCSMRVIAIQKGPSKGSRITINFVIEKEKFLGIATWSSRNTGQKPHLGDLENSSICISLGCYITEQLAAQGRKEGFNTIEKQLSSLRSTWPTGDQVSIDVMLEGKRAKLPLAPPFQVTPDNFVDISQFANEGANVVQLSHQRGLSRYTFVLMVHHPTQAQLNQVREHRQRDDEWAEWLKGLTKPFSLALHPAPEVM